jgi:hypothetical protein
LIRPLDGLHHMPARLPFIFAALVFSAACGSSATAPTTITPTSTSSTNLFQGTLDRGGTATQTYTAQIAGPVRLTLANVSVDPHQPLAQALTIAVGTSDCTASTTGRVVPALTAQVSGTVAAGTFCVIVSDPDSRLTQSVNFSVEVTIGSPSAIATAAGTSIWATNLGLGTNASASRLIPTFGAGTLKVSLDSLSSGGGQLGMGLGIPGPSGVGCVPAQVAVGGAATTLSAAVDSGVYCVEVHTVGQTPGLVGFSTTISYP